MWTLLVDPGAHGRLTVGGRIALAAAMFAAGQVLTDVLVFSFHGLYPAYHGAHGLSAHTDQQLAGVVMMVEQLLTLGTLVGRAASRPAAAGRDSSPRERDELQLRVRVPRARRRRRSGVRMGGARRPAVAAARGVVSRPASS